MGNKSQKIDYYEDKDINKIKQNYFICKERLSNSDEKYINLNINLHALFNERYNILFKEKYLNIIRDKIKLFKKDEDNKEVEKMKEILVECQSLINNNFDDFLFYSDLLQNIKINYEKNGNTTKESYEKAFEDIIDSIINTLIKFEKELFIIKDKIVQLNIII